MTRSLLHLLETAQRLEQKQVNLVSLRENIDTSTATGRCLLSMMGAMHQMEREFRAERASAGRASAQVRGKTGGCASQQNAIYNEPTKGSYLKGCLNPSKAPQIPFRAKLICYSYFPV